MLFYYYLEEQIFKLMMQYILKALKKNISIKMCTILRKEIKEILNIYILQMLSWVKKCILEKLATFPFGLYYMNVSIIETNIIVNLKFTNHNNFVVWNNKFINQMISYVKN